MEELDLKNKITIFSLGAIFLYIFVLFPLDKTLKIKNEIKNYNKKIYVTNKKIKGIEIKLDEKLKELERLENEIIKSQKETYSFSNINDGNIYISNLLKKYLLEVIEIDRIEIIDKNRCFIPYRIKGNEENIINFIENIEKENKILLLTKNFEIKKIDEEFELFLYFYFFVDGEKNKINKGERRSLINKFLEIKKIEFINDNTGICEINNKKFYIRNEKIIDIDGIKYKVILKNKKFFIKGGEDEK